MAAASMSVLGLIGEIFLRDILYLRLKIIIILTIIMKK